MPQELLAYGPPPLTIEAADAGLDMIDFIAAAVRGDGAAMVVRVAADVVVTRPGPRAGAGG